MRLSTFSVRSGVYWLVALLGQALGVQAQGAAPTWNWAYQQQSTGTAWPFDMAVDAAGNTYVVGVMYGTMTLSNGLQLASSATNDADGFLIKYTPAGTVAWARRLGSSPAYDIANGVALDAAGNVYVTGGYHGQLDLGGLTLTSIASPAYLAKYDAQGVVQWARQSTQHNYWEGSSGSDVVVDATGAVYITGRMGWGTTTFGTIDIAPTAGAAYAHFVTKYDAAGTVQWAQMAGSTTANSAYDSYLAIAPSGEVYLSCSLAQTAIFGSQSYPSRGSVDAFIVKYDALGNRHWIQQLGGPGDDRVRRGTVDAQGNLYVSFSFSDLAVVGSTSLRSAGNTDLALVKLTDQGALDWARTVGGSEGDIAQSATLDPFGNVYLAGSFFGTVTAGPGTSFTSAGHFDALLLSYTPQGTLRWGTAAGGYNPDDFTHVGFDGAGLGHVIGRYSTTLPLGPLLLTGGGNLSNWFVAQFSDNLPTVATLTTLAPTSGAPGQSITLTGSGFVGVTSVRFNGTPAASFVVQSPGRLTAVVPVGVTAGPVSVLTAAGTATSPTAFTPTVLSAAPAASLLGLAVYPNPTDGAATVSYYLPAAAEVSAQVYDVVGQRTVTLTTGERQVAGPHTLAVPALARGLYVVRLLHDGMTDYRKLVVE